MSSAQLGRTVFEVSRSEEYFNARELQAQTGQPVERFATVVLKELVDNALDACETAGVAPAITLGVAEDAGRLHLTVDDNGAGLAPETVRRIRNFQTRTSDKAAYRSPTRGAQGNALKTVLGIPHALGARTPVMIDACGVRHTIRAWLDPSGALRVEHNEKPAPAQPGTRVRVTLPADGQTLDAGHWARAFALFNPHAAITCTTKHAYSAGRDDHQGGDFYQATAEFPGTWRKWLPTDPTSAWWYDTPALRRLLFNHIANARQGGRDLTLREFVRQFRGLSGTTKAAAVCARVPDIARLTDFEHDEGTATISALLTAMQEATQPPPVRMLGLVGEEHLRARFAAWYDVKRWWYKKVEGEADGIPFAFEVALAETAQPGAFFSGINFSPTFQDPFAIRAFACGEVYGYGALGFLAAGHASPTPHTSMAQHAHTSAAVHLVCPALEFLDRGKTRLKVPHAMADAMAGALWRVVKDLYREEERRRKDAARAERQAAERHRARAADRWTLKEAVFAVLPAAHAKASGDGAYPVSSRTLYYAVREQIQRYVRKDLDYNYFSQQLLTEYRERCGPLAGLYYDPRGQLYEPHSGGAVALGTREVDDYAFPAWEYNKILYIEKKGLWPIIQAAQLAQRYDMAVVAAEGYASEAARTLFTAADQDREYRLFVLHDADPHGYNIARTLRAATRRMPGYRVDVVDLGLGFDDARRRGLQAETFTRQKALPAGLELTAEERRAFEGRPSGRAAWICERVELNAFTAPALVAYIEERLAAEGATDKVLPPENVLADEAERGYAAAVRAVVEDTARQFLDVETIASEVAAMARPTLLGGPLTDTVRAAHETTPALSWRQALGQATQAAVLERTERIREHALARFRR